ncbi:hypothetical protein [Protofrankia coriariae]|uniref:Uncharacterized protein n=1 Tax=Protofrankia coriariae TaxID=1562887 RepID=A0ABR5EYQ0_9ACTN|nr:hypothetical protein [Protofrankia coriariae]KLL09568.1 hypothetical protein FrCorBMG51_23960 [Protofrankia coriariae]ONH32700.1 hypothetical protein BL254_21205 [Protofrankia sp. BMG5.30]
MSGGEHARVTAHGDIHAITIFPADRPVDVLDAWAALPDGVGFADAFGDVEVTLVFRPLGDLLPPGPPGGMSGAPD